MATGCQTCNSSSLSMFSALTKPGLSLLNPQPQRDMSLTSPTSPSPTSLSFSISGLRTPSAPTRTSAQSPSPSTSSSTPTPPPPTEPSIIRSSLPPGKPKGTLKFSYYFGDKFTHQPEPKRTDEPITAYPPPQYAYPPAQHLRAAYPPTVAAAPGYRYVAYPSMSGHGQGYQAAPPPGYGYAPVGYLPYA